MKGSNPSINKMQDYCYGGESAENLASYRGVALKTLFFCGMAFASAVVTYILLFNLSPSSTLYIMIGLGGAGALIFGIIASFSRDTVKITGALYCLCEGILIGAVSAICDAAYRGVVLISLLSTLITLAVMVSLYAFGVVKVGHRFRSFMTTALISVCFIQLVVFLVSLFVPAVYNLFYGDCWFAMIVSAVMVLFVTLFLLVDLDNIARMVDGGMAKKYEWNAAYSLSLSVLWLYLEFLELFVRIFGRSRRD